MARREDVREFLRSRRDRVSPQQAGLGSWGAAGGRRVPGLRREEVALLAGVSVDYYIRLERGNLTGVSDSVLAALADALQLDEAERGYLSDLAREANLGSRVRQRARSAAEARRVRPSVQRILDAIVDAPAYIRNGRRDVLGANAMGRALYSEMFDRVPAGTVPNVARFAFLTAEARTFFTDWDRAAADTVAALRAEAGRHPDDQQLAALIGQLCTRSETFSRLWAAHNVRFHRSGVKRISHPVVGSLDLTFEAMELPADPGLSLIVYSAEPESASADGLRLLASWAATPEPSEKPAQTGAEHLPGRSIDQS